MLTLIFKSKELKFAIKADIIEEITRMVKITAFPSETGMIFGVVNYRSKTIPIVDIRKYLNQEISKYTKENIIIVLKNETHNIGVLADDVLDSIVTIPQDIQDYQGLNSDYFKSFIQYQTEIVPVLNFEKFISAIKNDSENIKSYEQLRMG
jgi:chemotaxis signal transduction protein